ncbi:metalloregulator ArsR/SmtB family transcription factor [Paenibacillus hunanensis]|uniref:DNA-binding transcriptional ArsR family regulator n=1 Tax=Paenibacillus hunanensis TaxID=539262 RepID=A0ABU1J4E5_9BACL|nr:metalloregulator ArsR/SmtB family transcription factor [Paenibacillus hunanensis]MCL9662224.1 metalloregulator ArsR/SmtB family transcription factor [Paenibacillus hunanensis]MDR6245442.1 DNA-binding transcriptional ArsR family regulator [Paenibacillus hunanensis]WPP43434.1 metalloregulator ArsR/SmtB family transcription factor [Paenibacillus hunanensis]GGJ27661.1 transcription regulator ArsR [Paenibacillus hunanensis]
MKQEALIEECGHCLNANEASQQELARIKQELVSDNTALSMAEMFKALGDPTRVRLIYALLQQELCVHDICEVLDMTQSAVSHQLRYLRNMRIVKPRKVGKTVFYSLDDYHVEEIFKQTYQHLNHN